MKRYLPLFLALLLVVSLLPMAALAAPEGPEITLQPQNYCYPEYSVAVYTVKAEGANLRAIWYLEYQGETYCLSDNSNGYEPWESYAGETYGPMENGPHTFSWFFGGIEAGLNGAEIWCVIEDGHYDVTSARAIITVQGDVLPPEILDMPAALFATVGGEAEVRCVAKSVTGAQLSFQWYETATGRLQDIRALEGEDADFLFCDTRTPGTRYYVCCVTDDLGGRAYSAVLPVTVTAPEVPAPTETQATTQSTDSTEPVPTQAPTETQAASRPTRGTEPAPTQTPEEDGEEAGLSLPWWALVVVGIAAAIAGAGITAVIIKKR